MKKMLVLVLVLACAPLWADGGWDLTKPANNGYVASFPAEVRANQTAIVASLTPPIEWTGEGADGYGTASAKLGFISTAGSSDIPAFWLGCLHDADDEDPLVRYFLGPQLAVPGDVAFGEYSGFDILVASDTEPSIFIIPPWNNWPTNGFIRLRQSSLYIGGSLKVSGVATGTDAQDAVNVGQMNAAIDSGGVLVVANMVASGAYDGSTLAYIPNGGGIFPATFTHEVIDTHDSWDGNATFTAPIDGLYEVYVQMTVSKIGATAGECGLAVVETMASASYPAPYLLARVRAGTEETYNSQTMAGHIVIPMQQNDTFYINQQASAVDFHYLLCNSTLIIKRIADLP